jgi:hypothetical protein
VGVGDESVGGFGTTVGAAWHAASKNKMVVKRAIYFFTA